MIKVTENKSEQKQAEVKYPCLMKLKSSDNNLTVLVSELVSNKEKNKDKIAAFIINRGESGFTQGTTAIVSKGWLHDFMVIDYPITLENEF